VTLTAQDPRPGPQKSRTLLYVIIGVFIAALVAIFVYNNALVPAQHSGDLNSNKVEGGKDLDRK
jgi:hypothetical protein